MRTIIKIIILISVIIGLTFLIPAKPAQAAKISIQNSIAELIPQEIELDTPLTFMSDEVYIWTKLGAFMRDMAIKKWTLRISGYGGLATEANKFIESILDARKQGKQIIMDVVGEAYSAHALITCAADKVILREGASLMFHGMSITRSYLFGLITYQDDTMGLESGAVQHKMFSLCKKAGVLNDNDIAYLVGGGNVVMVNVQGIITKHQVPDTDRNYKLLESLAALIGLGAGVLVLVGLAKRI